MDIIKTVITTFDVLLALTFFVFGKNSKERLDATIFGVIIVLLITNIFLMWI